MSDSPAVLLTELAAAALIGVDRAGGTTPAGLLTRAAVAATTAKAGLIAPACEPGPPCPVDRTRECSPRAAAILSQLIAGGEWEVAGEWAELATKKGHRVPARQVPAILDACINRPGLGVAFARPLGTCGAWLAGINPQWRSAPRAGSADIAAAWATGTTTERKEWLAEVRRTEPAGAIELVNSTWSADSADDRRRFVEVLAIGLSMADETFLESCLRDRSKQVRESAAGLLARLPGGRFVARMSARAEPLLALGEFRKGLLKKKGPKMMVEPPAEWDAALAEDGLEEKPPAGVGKRAWWLRQILSFVPPGHWSRRFGLDPDELIAALIGNDYEQEVLAAWHFAAPRSEDMTWCAALARAALKGKKGTPADLRGLWGTLPPEARETVLAELVGKSKSGWSVPWDVLAGADHAWSESFSRRMVDVLADSVPPKAAEWWTVGTAIDNIRIRIHPAAAADFEGLLDRVFKGDPPPSVTKAVDRLRLRAEMHKEFEA